MPITNVTRNSRMAMKKMTLAISTAAPAMPPKPSTAATRAMMRKVTTQLNMARTPSPAAEALPAVLLHLSNVGRLRIVPDTKRVRNWASLPSLISDRSDHRALNPRSRPAIKTNVPAGGSGSHLRGSGGHWFLHPRHQDDRRPFRARAARHLLCRASDHAVAARHDGEGARPAAQATSPYAPGRDHQSHRPARGRVQPL